MAPLLRPPGFPEVETALCGSSRAQLEEPAVNVATPARLEPSLPSPTRPPASARPGGPRRTPGEGPGASRLRDGLLALTVVGVLAGGTWGLLAPRDVHPEGGHSHAAAVATVDLPDGVLRVEGLVDKQVGHTMPGMSAAEDVPTGMRRFSVNVSIGATEDEPLAYSRRDFTVSGPGVKPVVPVNGQFDSGTLTPGRAISGSLSFDVPKGTTALSLQFRGGAPVALPALPPEQSTQHGGAAGHAGSSEAQQGAPDQAPADPGTSGHGHADGSTGQH